MIDKNIFSSYNSSPHTKKQINKLIFITSLGPPLRGIVQIGNVFYSLVRELSTNGPDILGSPRGIPAR